MLKSTAMRTRAITAISLASLYLGKLLSFLPNRIKHSLVIGLKQLIDRTSSRLSSLMYLIAYEMTKGMYFKNTGPVMLSKQMPFGSRMDLDVTKKTQRILYLQKLYEPYITNYLLKFFKPGDLFIDIGANVGYYTLLAAHITGPSGKVIAFEPEESNYSTLVKNVTLNKFTNAVCIRKAAGEGTGSATLYLNPLNDGGNSLNVLTEYYDDRKGWTRNEVLRRFPRKNLEQKIETISFDTYTEQFPLPNVSCTVKIDVEGAEYAVLKGMKEFLKRKSSLNILCEVSKDGDQIVKFLEDLGYGVNTLDEGGTPHLYTKGQVPIRAKALMFSKSSLDSL